MWLIFPLSPRHCKCCFIPRVRKTWICSLVSSLIRNNALWISQTPHGVDNNGLYLFLCTLLIYMWKTNIFNYRTKPKGEISCLWIIARAFLWPAKVTAVFLHCDSFVDFFRKQTFKTHFHSLTRSLHLSINNISSRQIWSQIWPFSIFLIS